MMRSSSSWRWPGRGFSRVCPAAAVARFLSSGGQAPARPTRRCDVAIVVRAVERCSTPLSPAVVPGCP
eukprot:10239093-Lingulodinium_polyedra.AAC.1